MAIYISTAQELIDLPNNTTETVYLTSSIDLTGYTYTPKTFKGTFDGNYHKITGLSAPLFDVLDGATVKNVKIIGANVQTNATAGAGILANTVKNATLYRIAIYDSSITAISSTYCGALIGFVQPGYRLSVSQCAVRHVDVYGQKNVGGLIGYIGTDDYTITDSYFIGSVRATTVENIGGFIGYAKMSGSAKIDKCYVMATFTCPDVFMANQFVNFS
ncbi:MAG: ZmpA/ZmpB/ZmpC family metallo-endopeptidase-related protein [Fervidobacterium sp.]|nr:ZmpA/ZmpB/ZmpC family metallo-endopeptidase-related protein [Fervidobacterium sp.]